MIIDYDHNPALTTDQKLQSLKESVQMALNELEANNAPEQKNSLAKMIIEDYTGSTLAGSSQSVKSAVDTLSTEYIVEQGTSDVWRYRKWNSGAAECWASINAGSIAMTTAEGSAYYAPATSYNYPSSLFTGYPSVTCSAEMGGALGGFAISANSASRVQGYWWATRSVTKSCYLYVYAIGRWK